MNTQEIKSALRSKKTSYFMAALLITIGIILVFHVGEEFGYRKAVFMDRSSANYYQAFGPRADTHDDGPLGYLFDQQASTHGVAGKIITITGQKILVADNEGIEKNVIVDTNTVIRNHRTDITAADLEPNDVIVVIGSPTADGSIAAKIIRVLPAPDSLMATSTLPNAPNPPIQ